MDLENLGGVSAEPMAGLATKVWLADKRDFDTIVDTKKMEDENPANVAGNLDELMIITDNHVFKTTKCFNTIDFVQETGEVKTKSIGPKGGKIFENEVTIEVAGSQSQLLGFMRAVKNKDLIVLVEEVGTGNIRQLGWSKYGAEASNLEHEITGVLEGKNSAKITFKDKNLGPASIYKGEISTIPAP